MVKLIIVIGRGHSGTRAISKTLQNSGVFMGGKFNVSADKMTGLKSMYEAVKLCTVCARYKGNFEWDFSYLMENEPSTKFDKHIKNYTKDLFRSKESYIGWKLPETCLAFPWVLKTFPNAYYIHWVRDPRDVVLSSHLTDQLKRWRIDFYTGIVSYPLLSRVVSIKFQWDIVTQTILPRNFLRIRLEDFVLNQKSTVLSIEEFLGMKLNPVKPKPEVIERWRKVNRELYDFKPLYPIIKEGGYSHGGNLLL